MLIAGCGGSAGGGSGSGGSGGGNSSTTVTFTITGGTPTAVASKVESGSFAAATLTAGNLTLSLPSGTTSFAVAYVCPPVSVNASPPYQQTPQNVVEASTLDGTSFSVSCSAASSTGATGMLTGSVDASAISGTSFVDILAQNGATSSSGSLGAASGNFSFAAPTGTDRVEVVAFNTALSGFVESFSMVAAKNLSSQAVPGTLNGGNTVVLGAADQAPLEPITYNSVPAGFSAPTTLVDYEFGGNGGFPIANAVTTAYPAVPAAAMENGDYYSFTAYAMGASGEVLVETTSTSGGPIYFTFPPAWTYAGPVAAKWLSFEMAYTGFSGTANVCDEVSMDWSTSSSAQNIVSVLATENYLNGSTTVSIPDLSGLAGFAAAPPSGTAVVWGATVLQGNSSCLQPPPLNATVKVVTDTGFYTSP